MILTHEENLALIRAALLKRALIRIVRITLTLLLGGSIASVLAYMGYTAMLSGGR